MSLQNWPTVAVKSRLFYRIAVGPLTSTARQRDDKRAVAELRALSLWRGLWLRTIEAAEAAPLRVSFPSLQLNTILSPSALTTVTRPATAAVRCSDCSYS